MAQLTSFLMTAGGDWALPLRRVPDRATYARQNLSVTLNFWLGEWFLDTRQGIDYPGLVYGRKYDKRLLEALFTEAARATTAVGSVDSLELEYDNDARQLVVNLVAATDEGDDISGPFLIGVAVGAEV